MEQQFNILIVGDKNTGKTSFIKKFVDGTFNFNYLPTDHVKIDKIQLNTNDGKVELNIFDGGYPSKVDGAIIFFDKQNKRSFDNIIHYYNWIISMFGNIPIIICGNKNDLTTSSVKYKAISSFLTEYKDLDLLYFDISAKSNYNFEKPFLFILKKLTYPHIKSYNKLYNSDLKIF